MGYIMEWQVSERIIHVRMWGIMSTEDVKSFNLQALELLNECTRKVHILIDIDSVDRPPMKIETLHDALQFGRHPSLGYVISYGGGRAIVRFVASLLAQMAGVRYRHVSSLEVAMDYLLIQDNSLNHASK